MAKPRQGRHDEVMLIPFLDILCSLIGILILVIAVLCVAQVQKVKGRTREDIELAQKYQGLLRQKKEQQQAEPALRAKVDALTQLAAKQQKLADLRNRLLAANNAGARQKAADIQNQIKDFLAQIAALTKSLPLIQAEIDKLNQELADRHKKPDDKPASVIVRGAGSEALQNQRLFFVEANTVGIVIHNGKSAPIRLPRDSVGVDQDYNAFLSTVKNTANASLIFLVRHDGWWSYVRAAGWAEQKFGVTTSKLPIPGDGVVDLSYFENP